MRATVFDLNPPLCAMRSLATEEAIVASSSPAPPLRGLGAHRDRCVAIFHGMSDDACKGAPAPARPHVCISARGAIGTHANADTCLRSRFAAIAQFTDAAVTTTIVDADAVVSAAAPPLPLLRPCRSDAGSWLLPCPPCGTAAASQGSRFERTSGVLMFGAAVGIRGRRGGAARSAFARICMRLRVVLGGRPGPWGE